MFLAVPKSQELWRFFISPCADGASATRMNGGGDEKRPRYTDNLRRVFLDDLKAKAQFEISVELPC
jgi:hypothetical protein